MLQSLSIKNYALIGELQMEFDNGFSVITGETGAGKSILLGAISLLLGERAETRMLKAGAKRCTIEAEFNLEGYDIDAFFKMNDIDFDGHSCIIRRELTDAGKSRAFINDTPVQLTLLRSLGSQLIDIHSQHQNLLVAQEDFQLKVVDIMAHDSELYAQYANCYNAYKSAQQRLQEAEATLTRGREDEDYLRYQIAQLDELQLEAGKQTQMEQEAQMLTHAEDISRALWDSGRLMQGDDGTIGGILPALREAERKLSSITEMLPAANQLTERISNCQIELKDIADEIDAEAERIEPDPTRLETINGWLSALYSAMKKHHAHSEEELIEIAADFRNRLTHIDNSDEQLAALRAESEQAMKSMIATGEALSAKRHEAAVSIEMQMKELLVPLGIPNVQFHIEISPRTEPSVTGLDNVRFMFCANKNGELRPISEIASGGEIARVMLSLKAMISSTVKQPTIIFDEIDTGVSGHMAERMATMMRSMGDSGRQVISITHLPQIAAMGSQHYRVYKIENEDGTSSHIERLSSEARITEVAHMLSGAELTKAAINNAKTLLKHARSIAVATLLAVLTLCYAAPLHAQNPKWQKKARRAMLSIITYDDTDKILGSTTGFFINADGTALSDYHTFRGASRAVAFDESGQQWPVVCIAGANSLYDVVKVKVDCPKPSALTVATESSSVGHSAFILPYPSQESNTTMATHIIGVSTFKGSYAYYTLPIRMNEKWNSCPVLDESGKVLGLLQQAASAKDTCSYVVSALFADSLHTNAMTPKIDDYQAIPMRKALPAEASQAHTFIFLSGTRDTASYISYVNDFIALFPTEPTGYTMLAEMQAAQGLYDAAEGTWTLGMKTSSKSDEIQYSRANTIYRHIQTSHCPESWTLETAMQEIESAYTTSPQPLYSSLRAQLLYSLKRYEEASKEFIALNNTKLRSADNFLYAAQCQTMLEDTMAVLALQDSAVACYTRPYVEAAAPALLMRANTLLSLGRYRDAVRDLNDYEHLRSKVLTANFYYRREQAEMRCRMFQQAHSDIERAVKMEPKEPLYHAEQAVVYYRFNQLDEAISAARSAIALDANFSDAHRILGVCLRAQGKEAEAIAALQKAIELGDPLADGILNDRK